jgi:monoterpene epsilon-lactone hydrolase
MPSLQSRLLYFVMRYRHLLRFQLKRETWDWNTSIPRFRQDCEKANARKARLPAGIEVTPARMETLPSGLSAEWIRPLGSDREKVIFFLHGGGFVSGSCNDHRSMVAKVVVGSGIGALLFE